MIWLSPIPIPYVSWLSTMEMIYTWQLPIPFPYHQSYCHLIFPIPISSRQTGDLIWEWYGYPWFLLHSNAIWWIFVCVSLVKSWNPSVWCSFSARILSVSWTMQLGSQIHIHFISLIHLKLFNSHLQAKYITCCTFWTLNFSEISKTVKTAFCDNTIISLVEHLISTI